MIIPVLFALAVVFVIYAICMFTHKGPLPCFHYLMLEPEERQSVLTDREYRNAGGIMLLFAVACAASYLVASLFPGWLVKYAIVLAACVAIYFFSYDLKPKKWEDLPESKVKKGGANDII